MISLALCLGAWLLLCRMASVNYTYNPSQPQEILMRGRPDEPDSWQSIAVYSKEERNEFLARGWKRSREFMEMADRARRKDA